MIAVFPVQLARSVGVRVVIHRLNSIIGAALVVAAAGAATAQPVATAHGRDGELSTAEQIAEWTQPDPTDTGRVIRPASARSDAASPWAEGLASPLPFLPYDAPPIARTLADGRIHGEVGAEGGNRGYGGYGIASGPLGKNGAVQVGVSDYQGVGGRRGGYWNGDHKSLNVTAVFDFSHDRRAPPAADDGAPAY